VARDEGCELFESLSFDWQWIGVTVFTGAMFSASCVAVVNQASVPAGPAWRRCREHAAEGLSLIDTI